MEKEVKVKNPPKLTLLLKGSLARELNFLKGVFVASDFEKIGWEKKRREAQIIYGNNSVKSGLTP